MSILLNEKCKLLTPPLWQYTLLIITRYFLDSPLSSVILKRACISTSFQSRRLRWKHTVSSRSVFFAGLWHPCCSWFFSPSAGQRGNSEEHCRRYHHLLPSIKWQTKKTKVFQYKFKSKVLQGTNISKKENSLANK